MALLANKTALVWASSGTSLAQIVAGEGASAETLCINEYPDLGNEQPDQVEITTLCDDTHEFMDGLKNRPEELAFPCNYSKALFAEINDSKYKSEGSWGVYFGDTTGTDGKVTFSGKVTRVVINGAGNGDVRTMTVYIKPTSDFTVA